MAGHLWPGDRSAPAPGLGSLPGLVSGFRAQTGPDGLNGSKLGQQGSLDALPWCEHCLLCGWACALPATPQAGSAGQVTAVLVGGVMTLMSRSHMVRGEYLELFPVHRGRELFWFVTLAGCVSFCSAA